MFCLYTVSYITRHFNKFSTDTYLSTYLLIMWFFSKITHFKIIEIERCY